MKFVQICPAGLAVLVLLGPAACREQPAPEPQLVAARVMIPGGYGNVRFYWQHDESLPAIAAAWVRQEARTSARTACPP